MAAPPAQGAPLCEPSLRVLMVAPTAYFSHRGCHVRIAEEWRALAERGVHVELCTYPHGDETPPLITHRVLAGLVPRRAVKRSPGPSWLKPLLDIALMARVYTVASAMRPHIIHAHLHEGAALAWPAAKLLGIPLVFDYQGSLTDELAAHGMFSPSGLIARIVRRIEGWIDRAADHIVLSNRMFFARLSPLAQHAPGRVTPLSDVIDARVFETPTCESVEKLAAGLQLPPDLPRIVYLGVLDEYQGTDVLLRAFARMVTRSGVAAHLLLFGYPNEGKYRALAQDLGVEEHVTIGGEVPYPRALTYIRLGDIAVAPKAATTESNGKILTYLTAGMPTIAFDFPVNRELMGDAGMYATYRDESWAVTSLAEAMGDLLTHRERQDHLRAAARDRVSLFSPNAMAEHLLAVYGRLSPA